MLREDGGRLLAGRYRLLERIHEAGAGEVWRARDERLGRDVAIKILSANPDERFRERFADEARRAAAVSHPSIVTVFDEGCDGDQAFMVMEYVRGRTLRDILAQRGPLPPHEAARILAQIAAALDAAHEAGVIHCDVKPANVIVDAQGATKLTDFGIARAAQGPRERELIGTARYIAPELIEGKAPTERSDMYSLGLVGYEMLAGRPAFANMETEDLLRARLEGPPPSLRTARVGVSAELDTVVRQALARDPRERYATAGAFARAFRAAAERGEAAGALEVTRTLSNRGWRSQPIDTTIALFAIIGLLMATIALFALFSRAAPAAPDTSPAGSSGAAAGFGRVSWDVDQAMVWYVPGKDCAKQD